jgi:hypothetical protein
MDNYDEILRTLGRIEGRLIGIEDQLIEIKRLSERVEKLETWAAWLKGGWAALFTAYLFLLKL